MNAKSKLPPLNLTPRQQDVLLLLAAGKKPEEIAAGLGISRGRVYQHLELAALKNRCENRTQLLTRFIKEGGVWRDCPQHGLYRDRCLVCAGVVEFRYGGLFNAAGMPSLGRVQVDTSSSTAAMRTAD